VEGIGDRYKRGLTDGIEDELGEFKGKWPKSRGVDGKEETL
jgi:hypothetical protein